MSGAADTAGQNIHQSAGEIGKEDEVQTEQTKFHNYGFICVQVE